MLGKVFFFFFSCVCVCVWISEVLQSTQECFWSQTCREWGWGWGRTGGHRARSCGLQWRVLDVTHSSRGSVRCFGLHGGVSDHMHRRFQSQSQYRGVVEYNDVLQIYDTQNCCGSICCGLHWGATSTHKGVLNHTQGCTCSESDTGVDVFWITHRGGRV